MKSKRFSQTPNRTERSTNSTVDQTENRLFVRLPRACARAGAVTPIPEWPPLPSHGFIRGRPATRTDVEAGNVISVASIGEAAIGVPLTFRFHSKPI